MFLKTIFQNCFQKQLPNKALGSPTSWWILQMTLDKSLITSVLTFGFPKMSSII